MSKTQEKKTGAPIMIIVLVVIVAAFMFWWFYNSSKSTTPTANRAANATSTPKSPGIPPNASKGAEPPNQLGPATAPVTIEEFADFQCGACAATHPVVKQIQSIYGSRIRFIYRHFPLPGHDKSYDASVAAEAAGLQNKFWDMQNQLFSNQQSWASDPNFKAVFKSYAERIGLDVAKWETDMAGLQAKSRVDADLARGRSVGVSSTPSLYINNEPVPFPDMNVQTLKQRIDALLQAAQPANSAAAPKPANAN